jgi:hypothetical protein
MRRCLLVLLLLLLAAPAGAQQGDPSFTIVNRTSQAMREIYVSPVTQQFWGRDLLGEGVLGAGRSLPVRIATSAGCRHDVRIVYANGQDEERRDQNTCAIDQMVFGAAAAAPQGQASGQASGQNASFNLVNHGRQPIRQVYISSARDTHWGDDRLGSQTLAPGRYLAVQLPANDCLNDVRVVWADGRAEDRRGVDTCRLVNLVVQ